MFEMSASTREPPQLTFLVHPILSTLDFSKMCMIHIASPHIIPAGWPSYWYFIIFRWWYQAKQALFKWRAMPFKLFSSRKIQTWQQCFHVVYIMARDILIEPQGTHIHSIFWDHKWCSSISKSNLVCECSRT